MLGSAKTNWPLLTLTSWVKGTSSFGKYVTLFGNLEKYKSYFSNALISCFSLVSANALEWIRSLFFPLLCLLLQDLTNTFWNCLILMLILMLNFKWSLVWPNILPILTTFALTRPTSGRLGSYSGRWWVWATCRTQAEQTKRWSSSSSSLSSLSSYWVWATCPTAWSRNWTNKARQLARAQIYQS